MKLRALIVGMFLSAVTAFALPYNVTTGSFDVATSVKPNWTAFNWGWSGQDYQSMSVQFRFDSSAEASAITNVYFRLSYPEKGPYYLQVSTGTISPSGTNLSWAWESPIAPSNIPPDETYYAEFLGVGAAGQTRSLAKGRVRIDWSLFSQSSSTSWVPINVVYAGSGTVSIAETDPIHGAWLSGTWTPYTNTTEGRIAANETFRTTTQPASNAVYEGRIAANETFRTTTQPATNEAFQSEFDKLGTASLSDSTNFATAAQGTLADSAVQTESDPAWAAVSNTVTTGAALGATSVQTESDPAWAAVSNTVTTGAALGATSLQPGADGTSTNLSEYNNDSGFLTSADAAPVQSVFTRTGDVVAVSGDYDAFYSLTGHVHIIGEVTGLQTALDGKASTNDLANTDAKADQGVTAYGWGDHALEGYLTTAGTRFDSMTVADVTKISSNISGLTEATYTGSVDTVSFTGTTATVQNRVYVWGFTKQNNNGTGTLTLAGATVSATSSGLVSNHFVALTADTDLVLRIDGTGSAKSDISNVFVREVTNGTLTAVLVQAPAAEFEALSVSGGTAGQVLTKTADGTEWSGAGSGDMLAATYATNGAAGKVDYAVLADTALSLGGSGADAFVLTNDATYTSTVALAAGAVQDSDSVYVGALTNAYAVYSGTTNAVELDGRQVKLTFGSGGGGNVRYEANTNSGEEVSVLASGFGVTATRDGTTITLDVPDPIAVTSANVRWNGAWGTSWTLVMATNGGVANVSSSARCAPSMTAWRESNGARLSLATPTLDPVNFDRINVVGMDSGYNNCQFSF